MKPPTTTVIGPGDKILIPPVANSIDWEGELAVVIGRKCKGVKAKDALSYRRWLYGNERRVRARSADQEAHR